MSPAWASILSKQLPLCGNSLVAIHVKDAQPNVIRGIPFGTGIVPFEAVFATLARMGFCGLFTVEMWADMDLTGDPLASTAAAPPVCRPPDGEELPAPLSQFGALRLT